MPSWIAPATTNITDISAKKTVGKIRQRNRGFGGGWAIGSPQFAHLVAPSDNVAPHIGQGSGAGADCGADFGTKSLSQRGRGACDAAAWASASRDLSDPSSRRAHTNSVARIPSPRGMTITAGPGATIITIPTKTTVVPTTNTTARRAPRNTASADPLASGVFCSSDCMGAEIGMPGTACGDHLYTIIRGPPSGGSRE